VRELGKPALRREDAALLRGEGVFVDNLDLPGAARVCFVRSTMAHALLGSVDVAAARAAPGVIDVFTGEELGLAPLPPPALFPDLDARFARWALARGRVRFVGEPLAAVIARDAYEAADAASLVEVDYEALPALVGVQEAVAGDVLLFPEIGTNVVGSHGSALPADLHAGADVVVRQRIVNHRVAPLPMEGRVCAAAWDGHRLTFYASSQGVNVARHQLADRLGLDPGAVRVIAADVGGGFGSKGLLSPEELVVAWLAIRTGHPLRWAETRSENLLAMPHGRGQTQEVSIGATRDGRLVSLGLDILQDAGAYPEFGAGLPAMTQIMSSGVYRFERVGFYSRSVLTTTTPVGAFRGAGRPEAAHAIERCVDVVASRLGMDPVDLRRRNLIGPESFPYSSPSGAVYDSGNYVAALDAALDLAGYAQLRRDQDEVRRSGSERLLGIGVSTYVEVTGSMGGQEVAQVSVTPDGRALVAAGSTPHGQGHHTVWATVASEVLGIAPERIDVLTGDTDRTPPGQVTGGSRSAQSCAVVITQAAAQVVSLARERAAALLEAASDDVVLDRDRGCFHVQGAPAVFLSWAQVANEGPLDAESTFERTSPTFPFGAHVAVVEVDTATGGVRLLRLVACDDAGTILNPLIVEGQIHGGLAQGAAQALSEAVIHDGDGNPLTANLADYAALSAAELPSFELVSMSTPSPHNELGTKGIGESGVIGSTPAVLNAVIDALAGFGVEELEMPVTPERVWAAMAAASGAAPRSDRAC